MRQQYETLRRDYQTEYKPVGAIENTLLDMLIFAAWQLYKVREMALWNAIDLGAPGSFGQSEKLARYRASHERLLFGSLNQLKQIQQERPKTRTAASNGAAAAANPRSGSPTQSTPSKNSTTFR